MVNREPIKRKEPKTESNQPKKKKRKNIKKQQTNQEEVTTTTQVWEVEYLTTFTIVTEKGKSSTTATQEVLAIPNIPPAAHEFAAILQFGTSYELVD